MGFLLTGRDSGTVIFQMGGGGGQGQLSPRVRQEMEEQTPDPAWCPFHQCLLLSGALSKQCESPINSVLGFLPSYLVIHLFFPSISLILYMIKYKLVARRYGK